MVTAKADDFIVKPLLLKVELATNKTVTTSKLISKALKTPKTRINYQVGTTDKKAKKTAQRKAFKLSQKLKALTGG